MMAVRRLRRAFSVTSQATSRRQWRERIENGPSLAHFINAETERKETVSPSTSIQLLEQLLNEIRGAERESNLVDTYGRAHNYLRISLTERCNLRCQYCMPEEGVDLQPSTDLLSTDEIIRLTKLFALAGVSKLRLTGGEPLVRSDILPLATSLKAIPGIESLGITTNGIALSRHLTALCDLPVRLNISLDTLEDSKFTRITRRKGFSRVWSAIEAAVAQSPVQVKLNCVVMRDFNLDEVVAFVGLTQHLNVDVRFIEWMPFDQNKWSDTTFVPYAEMMTRIKEAFPRIEKLEDHPNDTSKAYKLPDAAGQFGFITSMSEHFCGGCNRLRLTADGNLKVCLFGNAEVSLRDAMRHGFSNDDLLLIIQAAVKRKKFALGGHKNMYAIARGQNRPMILIGG
ncbi:hypothetical protein LEN26_016774 [Aphanomyces euteiches]|nr:hypothetical protein LEN26_016774 [Aphanomyces euteiches]KAH9105800.1 hypothetical protein AeMF1_018488 [Aphanomyces euteiches]KAH9186810.1 hypothetical protein AeNC1_011209 [Aphanomyces euteiches]